MPGEKFRDWRSRCLRQISTPPMSESTLASTCPFSATKVLSLSFSMKNVSYNCSSISGLPSHHRKKYCKCKMMYFRLCVPEAYNNISLVLAIQSSFHANQTTAGHLGQFRGNGLLVWRLGCRGDGGHKRLGPDKLGFADLARGPCLGTGERVVGGFSIRRDPRQRAASYKIRLHPSPETEMQIQVLESIHSGAPFVLRCYSYVDCEKGL